MSHCYLYCFTNFSPVNILLASKILFHRSRNVPSPPAAGRTPSASCLGGRSLILRSLRPAASGSANIIHVIVSCCALLLLVLVSALVPVAAVCLVRNHSVGQTVPWLLSCGHFFSSPALGSSTGMAVAFVTLPAQHESRQFAPLYVRDEPASAPFLFFNVLFPAINLRRREPPPTLLEVNKNNGEALSRTAVIFVFYPPRARKHGKGHFSWQPLRQPP